MSNNYAGKFVSAETAVKAVQPGDWVDYGFGAGFPELLDRALAARRGCDRCQIRGGLVIHPRIEVVESDPEQKAFSYYSWHIGDYERKLQTRGLCKFMPPMMLRSLPEMYRHHIRVDVAFVPVFPDRMRTATADWVFPTMHGAPSLRMRAPSSSRSMSASRAYRASMVPTVAHLSEADFIVEGEHEPLPIRTYRDPSAVDIEIAKRVVERDPGRRCPLPGSRRRSVYRCQYAGTVRQKPTSAAPAPSAMLF